MKKIRSAIAIAFSVMLLFVAPIANYNEAYSVKAEATVYVTKTGLKYHAKKCGNGKFTETTLSDAQSRGLEPCSKCFKNGSPKKDDSSKKDTKKDKQTKKELKMDIAKVTIKKGETVQLTVSNASGKVTWESKNKKVATVTSDGVVEGIKKGTVNIFAKCGKKQVKCTVTVK